MGQDEGDLLHQRQVIILVISLEGAFDHREQPDPDPLQPLAYLTQPLGRFLFNGRLQITGVSPVGAAAVGVPLQDPLQALMVPGVSQPHRLRPPFRDPPQGTQVFTAQQLTLPDLLCRGPESPVQLHGHPVQLIQSGQILHQSQLPSLQRHPGAAGPQAGMDLALAVADQPPLHTAPVVRSALLIHRRLPAVGHLLQHPAAMLQHHQLPQDLLIP